MKLSLVASPHLAPYLERLIPASPHQFEVVMLSGNPAADMKLVQTHIAGATDYDAVVLTDGIYAVPDNGLTAGSVPLVIPRVHNCVSLLLGGAVSYRRLFETYNGKICWYLPFGEHELHFSAPKDCTCLCYVADTRLCMSDNSLTARVLAQHNNWDYVEEEADLSLLDRLLSGDWDEDDILIVPAGGTAALTFTHSLIGTL